MRGEFYMEYLPRILLRQGCRVYVCLTLVFQSPIYGQIANTPTSQSPIFYSRNITHSIEQLAVNPRLIENGSQVLFLIFGGDPNYPKPWDYKLSRSDRDGNAAYVLTPSGVLDYNVLADEHGVLILMAIPALQASTEGDDSYEEIKDWELWHLDLESEEKQLLESSNSLPLSEGYKILGIADLPPTAADKIVSSSPDKTHTILVQRQPSGPTQYFSFFRVDGSGKQVEIFRTESWQSYHDAEWWPDIVWLNDSSLLTIRFQSLFDESFPQSEGLFSIVEIDLISGAARDLYSDFSIKPFPRMALNPDGSALFFQKFGNDSTSELWKLNLADDTTEMVYSVSGELGDSRFSADGNSLVFTEVTNEHFDIIRLDLERNSIENVVGR